MNEETTDELPTQQIMVIMGAHILALQGLITHLLCLSTIQMALARGDSNFSRVAKDVEDMAREQTIFLMEGATPEIVAVAMKFQKEIIDSVKLQMKNEVRILRGAEMHERRSQ